MNLTHNIIYLCFKHLIGSVIITVINSFGHNSRAVKIRCSDGRNVDKLYRKFSLAVFSARG